MNVLTVEAEYKGDLLLYTGLLSLFGTILAAEKDSAVGAGLELLHRGTVGIFAALWTRQPQYHSMSPREKASCRK